ncbi:MAG: L-serine ammonia-lyase [Alphaproteobacteria bacterium]|nr:L-serine ammonia-lyase [Alphaproteobacteria bacterium]
MFLSVFDLFKIGVGPSSSHTMGPMVAAHRFLTEIRDGDWPRPANAQVSHISVSLHGSLSFTGKGHASDRAILLGLAGFVPKTLDPEQAKIALSDIESTKKVSPQGFGVFSFDPESDLIFDYGPALPQHANGMIFNGFDRDGLQLLKRAYFSVGGGFVMTEAELEADAREKDSNTSTEEVEAVPYPFRSANEMLSMGVASGLSIADMKRENEVANTSPQVLDRGLIEVWRAMSDCMDRGLAGEGQLPGGLKVKRRAREIHDQLISETGSNAFHPHKVMDWLGVYAMAVNEENAAGGKVVTAPTNGAAGVVPAVIRYYLDHCIGATEEGVKTFLLVAGAIGGIIKYNASISGAEVGCQGEVGSASAMAAAGLCAVLGGSNKQVENAAEIALEHHLGMTCDPVAGLVQVPCIERNALGAVKAVTAASLALRGSGDHFVPLDTCIETMRQTGRDMMDEYKETSKGGLAVNLVAC